MAKTSYLTRSAIKSRRASRQKIASAGFLQGWSCWETFGTKVQKLPADNLFRQGYRAAEREARLLEGW